MFYFVNNLFDIREKYKALFLGTFFALHENLVDESQQFVFVHIFLLFGP